MRIEGRKYSRRVVQMQMTERKGRAKKSSRRVQMEKERKEKKTGEECRDRCRRKRNDSTGKQDEQEERIAEEEFRCRRKNREEAQKNEWEKSADADEKQVRRL